MIVTPKILARLVAIVLVGVLLQLSFFSQIALLHTDPDILPALVVILGLLGGSMSGAVAGFSIGLLVDCLLVAPLGATNPSSIRIRKEMVLPAESSLRNAVPPRRIAPER